MMTAPTAAMTVVTGRRARRLASERPATAVAPHTVTITAAAAHGDTGAPRTKGTKTLAAPAKAPPQAAMRDDVDAWPPALRSATAETTNHTRAAIDSGGK